jgi:putative ABC transport system permease protein
MNAKRSLVGDLATPTVALLRDLRYAGRSLRRAPVITVASVLTLALGIGVNTAVFSVLYGVVLRPLPYAHPDALVQVNTTRGDGAAQNISLPEFEDWRQRTEAFEDVALFSVLPLALDLGSGTAAVRGAVVSDRFFAMLGMPMLVGRALGPGDDQAPAVVISERLWRSRLGGDRGVVGRVLTLNGEAYIVAGIAPPSLDLPAANVDAWTPVGFASLTAPPQWKMRGFRAFSMIARRKAGVGLEQAQADASRIARHLAQEYPRFSAETGALVTPLRDRIAGPVRPVLLMLFAAVALVLLVACANLANLALARGAARSREMAVRVAIGASRGRLIAQLLAEGALVALGGATLGMLLAQGILMLLTVAQPAGLPRLNDVRLDAPVLWFTGALSVLSLVLFGTVPAVRMSRAHPIAALQEARSVSAPATQRLHSTLVVLQIAVSLVLLVGSALLARSLAALLRVDTGIRAEGVLAARLDLSAGSFTSPERQTAFLDRLLSEVSVIPGVNAAGIVSSLPPNASQMHTTMTVQNRRTGQPDEVAVEMIAASPGVFGALGVPLLRGRLFTVDDTASALRVVMLSDTLARRLFPDDDPLGRPLAVGPSPPGAPPAVVVGVVGDVRYSGLERAPDGAIYVPYPQRPFRATYLVVRTGDPLGFAPALQTGLRQVDASVAVGQVEGLETVVAAAAAQPRLRTWLLAGLSGIAVLLAAIGLYGVTAYGVSQRTVELGVRAALGAPRGDLLLMVLRRGLRTTVAGLGLGLVAAWGLTRPLGTFLYDVRPTDPISFVAAAILILLVGLTATLLPAWRATQVDPVVALRNH